MQSQIVLYMQAGLLVIVSLFPSAYQATSCDNPGYGKIEEKTARCYLSTPEWWNSYINESTRIGCMDELCGKGNYVMRSPETIQQWQSSTSPRNNVNHSYFGVCPCYCARNCEPQNTRTFILEVPCLSASVGGGPVPMSKTTDSHKGCFKSNNNWLLSFYGSPYAYIFSMCQPNFSFLTLTEMVNSLSQKYTLTQAKDHSVVYYGTCPCTNDTLCEESVSFSPSICPPNFDYDFISLEELTRSSCVQFVSLSNQEGSTTVSRETTSISYSRSEAQSKTPISKAQPTTSTKLQSVFSTIHESQMILTSKQLEGPCNNPGLGNVMVGQNITCFLSTAEWRNLTNEIPQLCEGDYDGISLVIVRIHFFLFEDPDTYYFGPCPCRCATKCYQSAFFTYGESCQWDETYVKKPAALKSSSVSTSTSHRSLTNGTTQSKSTALTQKPTTVSRSVEESAHTLLRSFPSPSTTDHSSSESEGTNTTHFSSSETKTNVGTTFRQKAHTASRQSSYPTVSYDEKGESSAALPEPTVSNILHSMLFTMVNSTLNSKKATETPAGSEQNPTSYENIIVTPKKEITVSEQRFASTTSPQSFHETSAESATYPAFTRLSATIKSTSNDGGENEPTSELYEGNNTSPTTIRTLEEDWHGILTTILRTERTEEQGPFTSSPNVSTETAVMSLPAEASTTRENQNFSGTSIDHTALRTDVESSESTGVYKSSSRSTTYEKLTTLTNSISSTKTQETITSAGYTTFQNTVSSIVTISNTVLTSSAEVINAITNAFGDDASSSSSSDSGANSANTKVTKHDEVTHLPSTVTTAAETKSFMREYSSSTVTTSAETERFMPENSSSTATISAETERFTPENSSSTVTTSAETERFKPENSSSTVTISAESESLMRINSSSTTTTSAGTERFIPDSSSTVTVSAETESFMRGNSSSTVTTSAETESLISKPPSIQDEKLSTEIMNVSGSTSSIYTLSANFDDPRAATTHIATLESSQEISLGSASEYTKSSSVLNTERVTATTFSPAPRISSTVFSSTADSSRKVHIASFTAHASILSTSDYESSGILSKLFSNSALGSKQYSPSKSGDSVETKVVTSQENSASSKNVESSISLMATTVERKVSAISTTSKMPESKSQRMMEMDSTESSFGPFDSAGAGTSQTASATYPEELKLSTTTGFGGGLWTETFASTPKTAVGTSSVKEITTMSEREFTSEVPTVFFDGSNTEATLTSSGSASPSSEQAAEFTTNFTDSEHKEVSIGSAITSAVTEHDGASTKVSNRMDKPVAPTRGPTSSTTFPKKEAEEPSSSDDDDISAYSTNPFESSYRSLFTAFSTRHNTNYVTMPLVSTITTPSTELSTFETASRSTSILPSPLPHSESLSTTASIQPNLQTTQSGYVTKLRFATSELSITMTPPREGTPKDTSASEISASFSPSLTSMYAIKEVVTTWSSLFTESTHKTSSNVARVYPTSTPSFITDSDSFSKHFTGTGTPSKEVRPAEPTTALAPLHGHPTTALETETSREWSRTTPDYCKSPCPPGYEEGPEYCYRILAAKNWTYRRAYKTCQEENSMMADEIDLRNSTVLEILDFLGETMNPVPERFFVNEQKVRSFVESASIRIVSRSETSRLHLAVVQTASPNFRFTDVYAMCKTTKYCADMYCNLRDYEFYETGAKVILPPNRTKLDIGDEISVSCDDAGVLRAMNVTCNEDGSLLPHPTYMNCSLNERNRIEAGEMETSFYSTLQKSCEDCHELGTSKCSPVEGGYLCTCKPEWTGFTCWKAPNQCLLQQLQCGPGGMCISEVDRAYCSCYEGYGGSNCEIVKENVSFVSFAQNKSSLINAVSAGAAAMTTGEIFVMAVKGLMKLYIPRAGKDTQVYYQNLRMFVLSIAGLTVLLFHHPSLFGLSDFHCTMWSYVVITLYSLGIGFFAMEAINVWRVTHLERKNFWRNALDSIGREIPRLSGPTLLVGIMLGGFITMIAWDQYYEIATPWSCLGRFTYETSNFWLPIVLVNVCAALTASYYAYISFITMKNIPQYREKMNDYLSGEDFVVKWSEEKCYRNAIFLFFQPWLLLLSWFTLAISSDWIASPTMNILASVFSILYSVSNLLQSIVTDPPLYSRWIWCAMKYLPGKLSPTYDPVMMYKQSEVQESSLMNMKKGQWKTEQRHPGYLPALIRNRLNTAWMRKYAKKKTENQCTKIEARFAVYIQEADRGQHMLYPATINEQIRILGLKWMLRTKRRDPEVDTISIKPRKELFCLLEQLSQVINSTKVLRPKMGVVSASNDCHTEILEEYKTLFTGNPFQACTLSQLGPHGNPKLMRYSLSPVDMAQIEAGNTLPADEDQHLHESYNSREGVDRFWMLRKEEKTFLRMKKRNDMVWEMAKQNSNFIAQSMAL